MRFDADEHNLYDINMDNDKGRIRLCISLSPKGLDNLVFIEKKCELDLGIKISRSQVIERLIAEKAELMPKDKKDVCN